MWWRTFFLQPSWSYTHKQNLGFAAAFQRMAPGVPLPPEVLEQPFNTNPVTSCYVLGFLSRQSFPDPASEDFLIARSSLASAFAATGDRLVWFLLRPLAGLVGAGLLWITGSPAAAAGGLLAAYNLPQLYLRASLWRRGVRGASPAGEVQRLTRWSERARRAGLLALGFCLVTAPSRGGGWGPVGVGMFAAALVGSIALLGARPRAATLLSAGLLVLGIVSNGGLP